MTHTNERDRIQWCGYRCVPPPEQTRIQKARLCTAPPDSGCSRHRRPSYILLNSTETHISALYRSRLGPTKSRSYLKHFRCAIFH
ncbi:hypothetical protein BABINDRAFT_146556 [Babjeviella inositovora NRRL Y-12698]|uniref:Uncharacterized protein n=1 Tax=Babjeviella inositovora NRRL Y-12698 TaxID=984486 RepID=A0A1E3QMY6_9ASCO|nr:uncharacterized protein BABINDRAFT_146556 [Babjeviella inositovora NRRL Y-12698]ODQ78998.1 hypothetical protein BABINDRAFT_146556 [Babjeviella inositovora NRRL Y-12698]